MRIRSAAAFAAVFTAALLAAPEALARGGGGSAGFGRGGGGLGRGFGHGHFFFIPIGGGGGGIVLAIIILVILVRYVLPLVLRWWQGQQTSGNTARRRVSERERKVELAAAEASEEDPSFAPELVRAQAARLFTEIQAAWDTGDRVKLRGLVAPELLAEWERRLDDFDRKGWRNRVAPIGEPKVQFVGLTHRGDESSDRVVVRIEATLRDYVEDSFGQRVGRVDSAGERSRVREFWTLVKREGNWTLQSIEQGAEGAHALREQIVATPWSDERSLRDEALLEGAVAEAVPQGTKLAEVADLDYAGDARAAALDLSLADGRFAPDVLEVAARRAVAAWADAVDGADSALLEIARPQAAQELLHPGDPGSHTRLVVRGLEIRRIRILALDAAAEPPTMTLELELAGRRYVEDRDTAAVISGSQARSSAFAERWVLALDGPPTQPWRIATVGAIAGPA